MSVPTTMLMPVAVDYTSKDFDGFKSSLLNYATNTFPSWTSRSEGDFGVLMVELFSYLGDILSYYGDRVGAEAFLPTATQRLSLLYLAQLLGYVPSNGTAASGTVTFQTANPGPAVVVPAGTQLSTAFIAALDGPLIYETQSAVTVPTNGGTASVTVVEGVTYTGITIGTSTGQPAQAFQIPNSPVIDGSVVVYVEDSNGNQVPWVYETNLFDASFSDYVFTTYVDSNNFTWIQFGDGVNGAIPALGLIITADVRVGGGSQGNVDAGVVSSIATENLVGVYIQTGTGGVPTTSAMTGGADAETNDQIRVNAPKAFQTQNRAVTLDDYAGLALSNGFIAKASAVANHYSSVTVYVAATGITTPNSTQLATVQSMIQAKAMAGTTVTVTGPNIVAIDFGYSGTPVLLQVLPRYSRAQVQLDVTKAFQTLFAPQNVDFGMRIALSDVITAVASVPGVQYIQVPVMVPSTASHTTNNDILLRPGDIPSYGTLVITASGGVS